MSLFPKTLHSLDRDVFYAWHAVASAVAGRFSQSHLQPARSLKKLPSLPGFLASRFVFRGVALKLARAPA
jgi:hypothetical protein